MDLVRWIELMKDEEREAVREALDNVRLGHLKTLEAVRRDNLPVDGDNLSTHMYLDATIARLRRQLKLPPETDLDRQRALTRDRVRRFRERQQAANHS